MYIIIMGPLGAWVPDGRTSCPPLDRPLETALKRRKKKEEAKKSEDGGQISWNEFRVFSILVISPPHSSQ
jgi:hypothetical protein